MRRLLCIAAVAGLSACDGATVPLPSLGGDAGAASTTVTRDDVKLSGLRGFCVDPQSSRGTASSAFVVFGNCAAITGDPRAARPLVNAVVTATVRMADPTVPKITQSADELATFFDSDVGHILISRDNTSDSVTVQESGATADGAFLIYITDTSAGAPAGTSNSYWRSYFDIKDTLVTISVLSLDAAPISRTQGLDILRGFTNKIKTDPGNRASRNTALPKISPEPQDARSLGKPEDQAETGQPASQGPADKTGPAKLLGRLFG